MALKCPGRCVLAPYLGLDRPFSIWKPAQTFRVVRMTANSAPSYSFTLPCQPVQPVDVIAAPNINHALFREAIDSSLFKQWLSNLQSRDGILADGSFYLKQVLIQSVDMFGERVGFLKFEADIFDTKTGQKVPGIVFARGPAVAVLILLESEGNTYAVLTDQARVPTGRFVLELPAGMLDDDNNDFVGTAVREVQEEIGIHLNMEDMVDLTALLDPSSGRKIIPSPGGCDEEISLFLYRCSVDKETIAKLQGKETGLQEHGEFIKVRVVPYSTVWRMTTDVKVLSAIAIYEMAKRERLLS